MEGETTSGVSGCFVMLCFGVCVLGIAALGIGIRTSEVRIERLEAQQAEHARLLNEIAAELSFREVMEEER